MMDEINQNLFIWLWNTCYLEFAEEDNEFFIWYNEEYRNYISKTEASIILSALETAYGEKAGKQRVWERKSN